MTLCNLVVSEYDASAITVKTRKIYPPKICLGHPVQPMTSAAMSGIGTTPLGPVEGTWVVGFFVMVRLLNTQ